MTTIHGVISNFHSLVYCLLEHSVCMAGGDAGWCYVLETCLESSMGGRLTYRGK